MTQFAWTVSKGWMAERFGIRFDRDYYFDPHLRHSTDMACNLMLSLEAPGLSLFFTESNLGRIAFHRPEQVLVGGIQPNMILAMLVGADFLPGQKRDADVSPTPLAGANPEELPAVASLIEHELVALLEDQYRSVDAEEKLQPVPPFFWDASGRAAVHGSLTTAQKLFGEEIFLDLAMEPARAGAILGWVTDATIALVRHFAELGKKQVTEIHVGECSACMIGESLFEQMVVPTVSRYGRELGPVRLHSCGMSDYLLGAFRTVENLHSLDVGGGTSVAMIRDIFGSDMPVDIAPVVDDLLAPTSEPLLQWLDRVLEENGGGPLTIVCHVEPGYNLDHLQAIMDHVRQHS